MLKDALFALRGIHDYHRPMTSSDPAPGRRRRREGDDALSLGRPEDLVLTTAQVAQMLHVTPKQVILLVQDGRIKAHRIHGMRQYLFWRQDIIDLIEASVVRPEEADEEVEGKINAAE